MDSLLSLHKFKESLTQKRQLRNGNILITCQVIYEFAGRTLVEEREVTIMFSGVEAGKVQIEEGEEMISTFIHLDFNHVYQKYNYVNGSLIITGDSPKMGGNYKVTLLPI